MDTKVATVYMRPAMSVPVEVGPGRAILFRGGHAVVEDPSAMPTLLCRSDLTIELSERYRSHLPVWLETLEAQVRKPQARVFLPGGVELTPPDYSAYVTENVPSPVLEALATGAGWDPDERPDSG